MAPSSTPVVRTLSDLLEAQAALQPDAEAITDGRTRLDWATYAEKSARLARTLADTGLRPGDRVAIRLPKSVESFVGVHAVLRTGGVVVPIDQFAPADYARGVIADADARLLLTSADASTVDALTDGTSVAGVIDPIGDGDSEGRVIGRPEAFSSPPHEGRPPQPTDAAYIIFTSGSTGRPKGIVHTHASALAYARRAVDTYGLDETDRLANIAPLHFDQSTFELYAGPLAGAAVLVVPDGALRFPASTSKLIAEERVTIWYSVPFAARQLAERGALDRHDLSALRWVLFGGESFPAPALATLMRLLPGVRCSNVYGPAETNQCTFHHLDEPPDGSETIPIGTAWAGTDLAVVDGGEVVDGAGTGELWISSPTMMREYWRQPEQTATALVQRDDLGSATRWYRTGDIVRRRADSLLEFVGRTDHQVKVRGHRVELEAVELAIAARPGVEACSVMVDGDTLAALVVPADLDRAALLSGIRDTLPAYAVPHRVVGVDSLPRTGTGKVDRSASASLLPERTGPDRTSG